MDQSIKIKNKYGEKIDTLVEGNDDLATTIVFVHGFGTDKNETQNLFVDIANALRDSFRIVRFDLSGYGKSEGNQEDANYNKNAEDLQSVLNWTKKKYGKDIYILAMSMGCYVTAIASPQVSKTILLSIPNHDMKTIYERIKNRMLTRSGSIFNEFGISLLKRSTGEIQKLGPSFWKVMKELKPLDLVTKFAKKTKLMIIHPLQDEIVGNEFIDKYQEIPGVNYVEINGDHSFKKKEDRKELIKTISNYF